MEWDVSLMHVSENRNLSVLCQMCAASWRVIVSGFVQSKFKALGIGKTGNESLRAHNRNHVVREIINFRARWKKMCIIVVMWHEKRGSKTGPWNMCRVLFL